MSLRDEMARALDRAYQTDGEDPETYWEVGAALCAEVAERRWERIAASSITEGLARPDDVVLIDGKQWRIEQDPSARTRHDRVTPSYTINGVTYDDNDRPMDRTPLYRLVPVEDTR